MRRLNHLSRLWAVTLLELMVVVLIISILSTIATGVYTGETQRARVSAAHALIHTLEVAITRYEMDTGTLPPSGTGAEVPPVALQAGNAGSRQNGSGYMNLVLGHSLSGNVNAPASPLWKGPYINLQADQTSGQSTASSGTFNILDPWGNAILYYAYPEYDFGGGSYWGGSRLFSSTAPAGANPSLPAPNPFAGSETFYNPRTFQLISFGPNATTFSIQSGMGLAFSYAGAEADDVTNFN